MPTQPAPNMRGLISLDGNTGIISTQLRLLPPSPKVLILPPLSTVVQQPQDNIPFDARTFIRHVHEVLSARLELARSFLQSSSGTQPRLVFMNGGTASALSTCIVAIHQKVTNGDIREAEELFNAIARGGVAGLEGNVATVDMQHKANSGLISKPVNSKVFSKTLDTRSPSTTSHFPPSVTDAADFIDRLIDSLQKPLPRLPVETEYVDMKNSAEDTRSTTTPVPPDIPRLKSRFWTDQQIIPKIEQLVKEGSRDRKLGQEDNSANRHFLPYLRHTSRESSTSRDAVMFQERKDFDWGSFDTQPERPASAPSNHVSANQNDYSSYVEGRLTRHVARKAKSVDCLDAKDDHTISLDIGPRKLKLGTFSPFTFSPLLMSETSSVSDSEISDLPENSSGPDFLPVTTRARMLETVCESSVLETVSNVSLQEFADHVNYAGDSKSTEEIVLVAKPDSEDAKEPAPFQPIFDLVEDLVIHFKDEGSNEVLESIVQSYKSGNYPITENNAIQLPNTPTSPASIFSSKRTSLSDASHTSTDSDQYWFNGALDLDADNKNADPAEEHPDTSSESSSDVSEISLPDSPSIYPSDEESMARSNGLSIRQPLWPKELAVNTVHSILKPELQTAIANPAAPPAEPITAAVQKIHELSDINTTNPVTLQNSLRAVLKIRYPPETTHYKQHIFALENDRFWKPIFQTDARQGRENRTVDQIIAIGYEDGVEKALCKELIEQLDKLGTSATGIRASKLDIRFLVIYAMQTFTSQPLSLQAGENPFSQPSLLATLLIPHLETFLSSSCPTRLLILHYPVSHLSTVLALRDLLGPKLLKVTGIIDSTAISPPKSSNERPNSIAYINEWVSTTTSPSLTQEGNITRTSRHTRSCKIPQPSFSKADFVLLSPASEEEISTFINSVWESLTFPSSSIYPANNILSPSSTPQPVTYPSTVSSHNSPPTPPPDRQIPVTRPQYPLSPTRALKRVSFADSTTSTEMSMENARRRKKLSEKDWEKLESERRERLSEKAWESFIMGGDSDKSILELERIFMPHLHFMPRAARRIGDSRKALKWLGLD